MNNPLASPVGPGYFKAFSEKNKEEDLSKIIDRRTEKLIVPSNPCQFPEKIYVINLDRREDRWESVRAINSEFFAKFSVERFSAIEMKDPVDSIFHSFIACLEEAFKTEECVIIMEDDCYLVGGGLEKLQMAFRDLPVDWDCLFGNHYFFGEIELLTDHLAKPRGKASTCSFVIFRNTSLQKITSNFSKRNIFTLDMDHFLTSENVPINNYTVWPMVSRETVSYSDRAKGIKDMTIRIREHSNLFQFIDSDTYYPGLEGW